MSYQKNEVKKKNQILASLFKRHKVKKRVYRLKKNQNSLVAKLKNETKSLERQLSGSGVFFSPVIIIIPRNCVERIHFATKVRRTRSLRPIVILPVDPIARVKYIINMREEKKIKK